MPDLTTASSRVDDVETRRGGDLVVESLRNAGVDVLFGLPGIQLDQLFCALHDADPPLRVINARHEQGVAYMALGYAQASGRIGVFAVVPGPGLLNAGAALCTAYATGAPLLALVGQIDSAAIGVGWGELHELPDQTAIVAGLTRWNALAGSPEDIPTLVAEAASALAEGRPGPAAIELPPDVLSRAVSRPAITVAPARAPSSIDRSALDEAAALLAEARFPLMFVGGGAIHAKNEVRAFAQRLEIPVASHRQGKGIVDDRDLLSIGLREASLLWDEADVLLAVGTRFHHPARVWGGPRAGQKLIRIDLDPRALARPRPTVAIQGDARDVLAALLNHERLSALKRPSRYDELLKLRRDHVAAFESKLGPQMDYVRSLRAALPDDGIVVADYTQIGYVATAAFPVFEPRSFITPGYQGTLGFSFATALGAKVACPDRAVLCISGDGGFLFTSNELATAVQHRIGVVTVVFNDGAYGNVRRMQEEDYAGRVIATDLGNPDFVRLAESFGAVGVRAETPQELGLAVKEGLQRAIPTIIETPVGRFPNPWSLLYPQGGTT